MYVMFRPSWVIVAHSGDLSTVQRWVRFEEVDGVDTNARYHIVERRVASACVLGI